MNKRIDFTNLGGFPMTQFTLDEMQISYRGAFAAMANLIGDKTILFGVEVIAGNVSDGWISYNGELLPFVGGVLDDKVAISEVGFSREFEDTNIYPVYFTKSATCAAVGDFDFAELVRPVSYKNAWLPGDLKQKYVDNAYIDDNFDVDGFGLNKEVGWRILSATVPDAAGKMFVNRDSADAAFDTAGKTGGAKTKTLAPNEQGSLDIKGRIDDITGPGSETAIASITINGHVLPKNGGANQSSDGSTENVPLKNDADEFSIMNPYFVVLTLIKL